MNGFLWTLATSDVSLAALGLLILAAAIVGYFPVVSSIAALKGYVTAARFALLLFVGVAAFLIGFRVADDRAEAAALREKIASAEGVIRMKNAEIRITQQMAEQADAERKAAAQRAQDAQDEINDYAERLKARPNAACLLTTDDFTRGVRNDAKR